MWDVVFRFVVGMVGGAAVTALVMMIRRRPAAARPSNSAATRAGRAARGESRRDPASGSEPAQAASSQSLSGDRLE